MRFFSPVVFAGFASYVAYEATNGDDRTIAFPMLTAVLPDAYHDPQSMGLASAALLAAFAVFSGVRALRRGTAAEEQ